MRAEHDLEFCLVTDGRDEFRQPDFDDTRLPIEVVDLAGGDGPEVFGFTERGTDRGNELEIVGVKQAGSADIPAHEGSETGALDVTEMLRLIGKAGDEGTHSGIRS